MSDYIGTGPTTVLIHCPGTDVERRKHKRRPMPEWKQSKHRAAVGTQSYDVADERFEKLVKSLALMDAYLARPSGGKALAWFEGVGLSRRASMQVG